jgi:hypothetical protein
MRGKNRFRPFLSRLVTLISVRSEKIRCIEFIVATILSIFAVVLLGVRATHAGPLWRDECDSVATATLPSFSELLRYFQFDSFPLPFVLILRGYIAVAGNTDISLRVFGALVGISLLLLSWWSARRLSANVPLAFLTLAVLNPTFLTWGTTVRGYGIGSVMIVFAFVATANFLAHRTTRSALLMYIAFLGAVQSLVSNTVLVFAVCLAAIGVCVWRGDHKASRIIAGGLGVAAVSFLPYIAVYLKMGWHVLLQTNVSLSALWQTFCDTLGAHNPAAGIAWLTLIMIAAVPCFVGLAKRTISPLSTFAPLTALLSLAGTCVFLKVLSYPPQRWYFLPLICLLAGAVDLAIAGLGAPVAIRFVRLLGCLAGVLGTWSSNCSTVIERQSNVDLIANWVGVQARPNDLVLVNPWFFGISFNRYYQGTAPWITLPNLSDRRIHRYDLLQAKMSQDDPLNELKAKLENTLRSGGRIYLVGCAHWLREDEQPTALLPAPQSQYRWSYLPYTVAWSEQIGSFLIAHVQTGATLPEFGEHINAEEDIQVCQVAGWHD